MLTETRVDALIVGAGIAGAACAARCRDAGLSVLVLDRGRRVGGRLAVRTLRGVPAAGRDHPVDVGAAGFAVSDPGFRAVVVGWRSRGLVREWTDAVHAAGPDGLGPARPDRLQFAAPNGLRSLVEDLLSGTEVRAEATATEVGSDLVVAGIRARTVVLAMPGPQAARLLAAHPQVAAIADQIYEPSLSLLARWPARAWPVFDRAAPEGVPEIGLLVDDGRRRGDDAPVLVAHATAAFAAQHLADPDSAVAPMLAALRRMLDLDADPVETRIQRWTYSQPAAGRDALFHLAGGIGLAGDGWSPSGGVEGAWRSGDALGAALVATT